MSMKKINQVLTNDDVYAQFVDSFSDVEKISVFTLSGIVNPVLHMKTIKAAIQEIEYPCYIDAEFSMSYNFLFNNHIDLFNYLIEEASKQEDQYDQYEDDELAFC